MSLEVGQEAPDFTLQNQFGEDVKLSDFRGKKNVVLVFYPMAFTGICTGELCEIRDQSPAFVSDDVQVLGISCDTSASLKVFAEQENFDYPLLSDFWPHGEVSKAYGSFFEPRGFSSALTCDAHSPTVQRSVAIAFTASSVRASASSW